MSREQDQKADKNLNQCEWQFGGFHVLPHISSWMDGWTNGIKKVWEGREGTIDG